MVLDRGVDHLVMIIHVGRDTLRSDLLLLHQLWAACRFDDLRGSHKVLQRQTAPALRYRREAERALQKVFALGEQAFDPRLGIGLRRSRLQAQGRSSQRDRSAAEGLCRDHRPRQLLIVLPTA